MRDVYGSDVLIERHPDTGRPVLLPNDRDGESR